MRPVGAPLVICPKFHCKFARVDCDQRGDGAGLRRSKQPMQRQPPYGSMPAAFHTEFFVG